MVATVNLGVGAVRVRSGKTDHPRVDVPKEGRPWHWRVTRLHLWKHMCGGGSGKMEFYNKIEIAIESELQLEWKLQFKVKLKLKLQLKLN